jgi:hypothetical protein
MLIAFAQNCFTFFTKVSRSPDQSQDQGDNEQNHENKEQDFRDSGGRGRNSSKTEYGGYNRDNQKYYCPVQHCALPFYF